MKINIKYIFLLLTLIILLFNNYEVTFLLWTAVAVITLRTNYSAHFLKILGCFLIILLISHLTDLFFYDNLLYNKLRDISYLTKPILGLLIGYNLAKHFGSKTLYYFINAGIVIACVHLFLVLGTIFIKTTLSVAIIREYCGYFNDYEPYILILLIFHNKFGLQISKKKMAVYLVILGLSTFFYLSRVNFIQLIVLSLGMLGYFKLTVKSLKIGAILGISLVFGYLLVYNYNPRRNAKGVDEFLYKIKIIPMEAFKTRINKEDWQSFNDNFRSFENIQTVKQIFYGGNQSIISGNGLGSTVDIGRKMWTNDGTYVRYYPVLHNAFATILLKAGMLGIIFYTISIFFIGKKMPSDDLVIENVNKLLFASAVFLVISSWVFMGFYLKLDNKSIFIGALIGFREFMLKSAKDSSPIGSV